MSHEFYTAPWDWQREAFAASKDERSYAYFAEQGTGKTHPLINEFWYNYDKGRVDTLVVVALSGVHTQWVQEQLPRHTHPDRLATAHMHVYRNSKAGTQWHQKAVRGCMHHDGPVACTFTYNAYTVKRARNDLNQLLKSRNCFVVLDESTEVKTPKAKRTMACVRSGQYARMKRLADGTPVTQGPFDIFAPVRFLDPDFWKRLGMDDFGAYKAHFGIWKQIPTVEVKDWKTGQMKPLEVLKGYKNLGELQQLLAPFSVRVLKDDVLDLPPKTFDWLSHELSPQQMRLYKELRQQNVGVLDSGDLVIANLPITKLLRFQQIVCGYIPVDDPTGQNEPEPVELCGGKNMRLENTMLWADHLPHKGVIWGRFNMDIDQIMHRLGPKVAVQYDGRMTEEQRDEAKWRIMNDRHTQFFVGKQQVAGIGLDGLQVCKSMLYYSNSFSLRHRLQSEDRLHRGGQTHPVNITDMYAEGVPIDRYTARALRRKFDIASKITGDGVREWIKID